MEDSNNNSSDEPPSSSDLLLLFKQITNGYSYEQTRSMRYARPALEIVELVCKLPSDITVRYNLTLDPYTKRPYGEWVQVWNGKPLVHARSPASFDLQASQSPLLADMMKRRLEQTVVENT